MLATGASNGDRDITAVVPRQANQPVRQKLPDVIQHLHGLGLLLQKLGHGGIAPGLVAQRRLVVRVGQHAHVKYKVGVGRNAAFVRKRFKHQSELPTRRGDQ